MAFNMTTTGSGWRLAGCLVTLGHEIPARFPSLTCDGTIGDATHAAEGLASDHNPFVKDPHTGLGIVRAIDIAGDDATLQQLQNYLWSLYAQSDNRLFDQGYVKGTSRNLINNTGLPFGTHMDMGDGNHLHVSVTRVGATGYAAAIDDTRTWFPGAVLLGGGTPISTPAPTTEDDMFLAQVNKGPKGEDPGIYLVGGPGGYAPIIDVADAESFLGLGLKQCNINYDQHLAFVAAKAA